MIKPHKKYICFSEGETNVWLAHKASSSINSPFYESFFIYLDWKMMEMLDQTAIKRDESHITGPNTTQNMYQADTFTTAAVKGEP